VGTDHYTSVSGCTGKQFSEGPVFVLWVHLSFLRSEWIYKLFKIPYAIFVAICVPLLILHALAACIVCLVALPFLAFTCCCCCFRDSDGETSAFFCTVMKYILIYTFTPLTLVTLGLFEIIWFPIALVLWVLTFPFGVICRPDVFTPTFIRILDPDRPGYVHMYWWFPFSAIEQFWGTSFTDLKTMLTIHLENY
jgi:hypothetical protein